MSLQFVCKKTINLGLLKIVTLNITMYFNNFTMRWIGKGN